MKNKILLQLKYEKYLFLEDYFDSALRMYDNGKLPPKNSQPNSNFYEPICQRIHHLRVRKLDQISRFQPVAKRTSFADLLFSAKQRN